MEAGRGAIGVRGGWRGGARRGVAGGVGPGAGRPGACTPAGTRAPGRAAQLPGPLAPWRWQSESSPLGSDRAAAAAASSAPAASPGPRGLPSPSLYPPVAPAARPSSLAGLDNFACRPRSPVPGSNCTEERGRGKAGPGAELRGSAAPDRSQHRSCARPPSSRVRPCGSRPAWVSV